MSLVATLRRALRRYDSAPPFRASRYWEDRHRRFRGSYRAIAPPTLSDEANAEDWEIKRCRIHDALHRYGPEPMGAALLDAGCGTGVLSAGYAALGYDVVGVDFSPTAIRQARARGPTVRFMVGDLARLNLGRRFDVVTACEVLLHVVDDDAWRDSLGALAGHLRAEGVLVIVDSPSHAGVDHAEHCRPRSIEQYERGLGDCGLVVAEHQQFTLPGEGVVKDLLVVRCRLSVVSY